jgi:predicted dehydrogenase
MPSILFLGCGSIARAHSKRLRSIDRAIPRYYASRTAERAAAFNRELDGSGSFASYEAGIASDDVDTTFICTPPDSHLDLALRSLEAGKHVIVEKPPFFSVGDFDQTAEAARRAGRLLLVAENYYYKPLAVVLRRLLSDGVVGSPLVLTINALKKQDTGDWRDDAARSGGGALFEGGIHWINFMANLGPEVASIRGLRAGPQAGLDRTAVVLVRYENDLVGTLSYSWEVPTIFQGLRISRLYGTKGSITFETNGLFVVVAGTRKRVILPGLSDISGYRAMMEDFTKSLDQNHQPQFTTERARRDMVLLERAYATMTISNAPTGTE